MKFIYRAMFSKIEKFEFIKQTDKTIWLRVIGSKHIEQERKESDYRFYGKSFEEAQKKMIDAYKEKLRETIENRARAVAILQDAIDESTNLKPF